MGTDFCFSQPTFREASTGVAVIPLHTLWSGFVVQIRIPRHLAACGLPHGTTYVPKLYFICH